MTARKTKGLAALGFLAAVASSAWMWGFTVDDALISIRYAHHLAAGAGYRFDAAGPSTDGVTPLPWPFLLIPLATTADALRTLALAKVLGIVAWALAAAALGARAASLAKTQGASVASAVSLVLMGLAFPVGAWAASGMETGLVTALATLAVTRFERPRQVAAIAGFAAALRPELVVWSIAVSGGASLVATESRARTAAATAIASLPFLLCAVVRLVGFGLPAPLAVLAKPSDLSHGALYAAASFLVLLLPIVASSPIALRRAPREGAVIALAFLAHLLVVVAVGGDWMPYARLLVPVTPSLVLVVVVASPHAARWAVLLRFAIAGALGVGLALRAAPAGRGVLADREDLVRRARPVLAGATVVAALDVGWVSASTDARIVDLAGLTDPSIALLSGGHTSKRVDVSMLLDRGVDVMLVYSDIRVVEARLVGAALFRERFEARETLPLGSRGAFYTVYRRR